MEELSGLDAAFVYLETPNQHLHVSLVMVLDPAGMPGGYSFDGLKRHLAARLHRVPLMRRRLAAAPWSLGRPVWVDTDTDIDAHMQATTCPAPGDEAELPGWRLRVREVAHHRAERVRIVRTTPAAGEETPV